MREYKNENTDFQENEVTFRENEVGYRKTSCLDGLVIVENYEHCMD